MLGAGAWTQVIRIENDTAAGRYPSVVYALVFELSGILWFYTDTDGTQSLSTHLGTVDRDKENLGSLLLQIDPGFRCWSALPSPKAVRAVQQHIPNGCFIESVALLRRRVESGMAADQARLLSYYVNLTDGLHGHTVLQFCSNGRAMIIDPDRPGRVLHIRPRSLEDPASCIACVRGDVARARWIRLEYKTRPQATAGGAWVRPRPRNEVSKPERPSASQSSSAAGYSGAIYDNN